MPGSTRQCAVVIVGVWAAEKEQLVRWGQQLLPGRLSVAGVPEAGAAPEAAIEAAPMTGTRRRAACDMGRPSMLWLRKLSPGR